ncbi:MAG: type II secretion system F family protein [Smithella sp.]
MILLLKTDKPTQADLCQFFRIICRYYSAGISLINSVEQYRKNCEKKQLQAIMQSLLRDMREGLPFSDAMRKAPFFPAYIVELMHVAESTGQIKKILDEIVFFLEQNIDIKREVNSGLYPAKFFLGGVVLSFCMAIFVLIPKMADILNDLNTDLPMITAVVLNGGMFLAHMWPLFALLCITGFPAYQYAKKMYPERIDRLKLKLPFFGQVNYYNLQYEMTKILSLVLQSGIPMQDALKYTAIAVDHIPLKNTLYQASAKVKNSGSNTADALQKADTEKLIHHDLFIMIRAGEESGKMVDILEDEAEDFRKDLLALSKNLGNKVGTSIIIPGMLCIILLMISIFAPLIHMMTAATSMM